jgi:hypothetical protein
MRVAERRHEDFATPAAAVTAFIARELKDGIDGIPIR